MPICLKIVLSTDFDAAGKGRRFLINCRAVSPVITVAIWANIHVRKLFQRIRK